MQILHLDSSIQGDDSVSRRLTAALVRALREDAPDAVVNHRDLAADPIPHLNGAIAGGFRDTGAHQLNEFTQTERTRSEILVTELLASDVIVVGAPMYNFSVPTQLKAWIDRIVQPGRTFRFSPAGAVGQATGIRAVVASSRGGVYSPALAHALDFQENYLRAIFGFIGIADVQFVRAEGVKGPDGGRSIEDALRGAPGIAKAILA
jgi:FMN-dependent NADH-azoreductase